MCDVLDHLGRYGLLNPAVFVGKAGGAVLEQMVEPRVFLDEVLRGGGEQPPDGREVQRGDDLAVEVTVEDEDGAVRLADVFGRVVVDEPLQPGYLHVGDVFAVLFRGQACGFPGKFQDAVALCHKQCVPLDTGTCQRNDEVRLAACSQHEGDGAPFAVPYAADFPELVFLPQE